MTATPEAASDPPPLSGLTATKPSPKHVTAAHVVDRRRQTRYALALTGIGTRSAFVPTARPAQTPTMPNSATMPSARRDAIAHRCVAPAVASPVTTHAVG